MTAKQVGNRADMLNFDEDGLLADVQSTLGVACRRIQSRRDGGGWPPEPEQRDNGWRSGRLRGAVQS